MDHASSTCAKSLQSCPAPHLLGHRWRPSVPGASTLPPRNSLGRSATRIPCGFGRGVAQLLGINGPLRPGSSPLGPLRRRVQQRNGRRGLAVRRTRLHQEQSLRFLACSSRPWKRNCWRGRSSWPGGAPGSCRCRGRVEKTPLRSAGRPPSCGVHRQRRCQV